MIAVPTHQSVNMGFLLNLLVHSDVDIHFFDLATRTIYKFVEYDEDEPHIFRGKRIGVNVSASLHVLSWNSQEDKTWVKYLLTNTMTVILFGCIFLLDVS